MKENQEGTSLKNDYGQKSTPLHKTLKQIYDEVVMKITASENEWKEFLNFYSRLYKYSFESAALMYAQRPDATLVADMETWNRKVGRWINTRAKSIKVFDNESSPGNAYPKMKYVFDIKDTNGNPETIPRVWSMDERMAQMVAGKLDNYYLGEDVPLDIVIGIMAETKAVTKYDEIMHGLLDDLKNTDLNDLPYEGVEDCFRQCLVNSVIYLVGRRCGIKPEALNEYDINVIRHFKSKPIVARLGSGITRISQEILMEIEASVKQILNEKRSGRNDKSRSETELHRERRDNVSRDTELQQQGGGHNSAGQIRADGPVLHKRELPPSVHISSDGRGTSADDTQGEPGGPQSSEYDNGTDAKEQSNTGPGQHLPELSAQDAAFTNSGGNNTFGDSVQGEVKNIDDNESHKSGSFFMPDLQQSIFDIHQGKPELKGESDKPKTVGSANERKLQHINYRYSTEDGIGLGGAKTKYKSNVEAIKTLKVIENEKRLATLEEQKILARFTGWGGMPQAFDPDATGWEKEYTELKTILTKNEEYERARASTPNAHYTPPVVIKAIYKALDQFGFEKGNILEPSMGIQTFYGNHGEDPKGFFIHAGMQVLYSIKRKFARKQFHFLKKFSEGI